MFIQNTYKIIKLRNISDTKCSSYKMLGYEIGVTSCGYKMFVTKFPSYDMCGNRQKQGSNISKNTLYKGL